jgi:hypothetical protein
LIFLRKILLPLKDILSFVDIGNKRHCCCTAQHINR